MTWIGELSRIDVMSADPVHLADFYEGLGFTRAAPVRNRGEARLALRLGDERVDLVRPATPGAPYPPCVPGWSLQFQHFAIVVSDMRQAYARLQAQIGWTAISTDGPVRLPEASGGATAFKFRDPEGHPLELIAFLRTGRRYAEVLIGIDHSAISVADTRRSTRFYEQLGLIHTGGSLNTGPEQARLDGISEPVVEVTALTPGDPGPHLELLCYRGSFTRAAHRPNPCDVAATRLIFGETATMMVYDPDDHVIVIEEREPYSGST
jgi:catechol 2,3-dioxygenase-like lactoylglutathione lyase family enzyme